MKYLNTLLMTLFVVGLLCAFGTQAAAQVPCGVKVEAGKTLTLTEPMVCKADAAVYLIGPGATLDCAGYSISLAAQGVVVSSELNEVRNCIFNADVDLGVVVASAYETTIHSNTFHVPMDPYRRSIVIKGSKGTRVYNNILGAKTMEMDSIYVYGSLDVPKKGENIVRGPYLGGNFWKGISETCIRDTTQYDGAFCLDTWTEAYMTDYFVLAEPTLDPAAAIAQLTSYVLTLNIHHGIENSLDAKLNSALNALDDLNENNDVAAINSLEAFINAVEAQSGGWISSEDAAVLIRMAQDIIDSLMMP